MSFDEFDNKPYYSVAEYIRWLRRKRTSYAHELELAKDATARHAKNAERLTKIKEKHQAIQEELDTFDHRNDNGAITERNSTKY